MGWAKGAICIYVQTAPSLGLCSEGGLIVMRPGGMRRRGAAFNECMLKVIIYNNNLLISIAVIVATQCYM